MARWFDAQLTEAKQHLEQAKASLEEAKSILETLKDEQQEKLDNMPESLQGSSRYETMDSRLNTFTEGYDALDEIDIDEIISSLDGIE